jgi:drug/metabolite transporter (DMT)-like permease
MSTAAFFVSLLEPLITKSKFQPVELLLGLMVVVGIYILTGVGKDYYLAIVVGLISAFLAALFSVLNKKYIANQNSLSVSTIELFAGFLFISITLPLSNKYLPQPQWIPAGDDWIYLLVLGLLCTSLAFALSIESLKELSAFVATLSVNLEPVYGIILAVLILKEGEELNTPFYVGTAIILLSVVLHPILVKVKKRRQKITS